jgi:hypothetical protein
MAFSRPSHCWLGCYATVTITTTAATTTTRSLMLRRLVSSRIVDPALRRPRQASRADWQSEFCRARLVVWQKGFQGSTQILQRPPSPVPPWPNPSPTRPPLRPLSSPIPRRSFALPPNGRHILGTARQFLAAKVLLSPGRTVIGRRKGHL